MVALTSVTFRGKPNSAVRLRTRLSGGAEPAQTAAAETPLGGTSVVQMSSSMVSKPMASHLWGPGDRRYVSLGPHALA